MRKVWAFVLALVMAMSLTCTAAWADGAQPEVVAMIGTATYTSLADAVAAGSTGEIKLTADIAMTATQVITQDTTIDLNGTNLTAGAGTAFKVTDGTLTLKDTAETKGSFAAVYEAFRVAGSAGCTPKVIVSADTVVKSANDCCIYIFGENAAADVYGSLTSSGAYATIQGNGNATSAGTNIGIFSGAVVKNDNTTKGGALYIPQAGVLQISGGVIEGYSCVIIKSGTTTISGGEFKATAPSTTHKTDNNGSSVSGYTLALVDNGNYVHDAALTVTGGTFTGPVELVKDDTATENGAQMFITGGTFSVNPIDYVAKGYAVTKSGAVYTVNPAAAAAAVELTNTATATNVTAVDVGSADTVIIDVSSTGKENVTMDKSVVSTVFGADKPVEIKTEGVGIVFDKTAAGKIAAAATDTDVALTMNKVVSGNTVTLTITALAGENKLLTDKTGSGAMVITMDVSGIFSDGNRVSIVHKDANGVVKGTYTATVANGKVSFANPNGLSSFAVSKVSASGSTGGSTTYTPPATTTNDTVEAPKTGDMGVALYAVSAVMSLIGMGYLGKKKTNG